jgi:hypothetical protein
MKQLILLSVLGGSIILCGCGANTAEAPPAVTAGQTNNAPGKAGQSAAKGASPNDLTVPTGSEAHFGSKVPGGK